MNKSIKLFLVGVLCSLSSYANPGDNLALMITTSGNTKIYFNLKELPVLTSDDDNLKIINKENENVFAWKDIKSLVYITEKDIPDEIISIRKENSNIIFRDNGLYVTTNKLMSIVIYNMNGQVVYSEEIKNNKFVDFARFQRGNYLFKSGSLNLKFYIR